VVVESARTDRVHVSRLAALSRRKQTDNVDLGALVVFGVGIIASVIADRRDPEATEHQADRLPG